MGGAGEELQDIEGDVLLLRTHVAKAENISGAFRQRFYDCPPTDWSDDEGVRTGARGEALSNISGTVDVDVAKVALEVSGLKGDARVRNRFGATRAHLAGADAESRYRFESDSGEILLFADESTIGELDWALYSMCGRVRYAGMGRRPFTGNDPQAMIVSTVEQPHFHDGFGNSAEDVDRHNVLARSVSGTVTIERVR